jgi:hypothetical protein
VKQRCLKLKIKTPPRGHWLRVRSTVETL